MKQKSRTKRDLHAAALTTISSFDAALYGEEASTATGGAPSSSPQDTHPVSKKLKPASSKAKSARKRADTVRVAPSTGVSASCSLYPSISGAVRGPVADIVLDEFPLDGNQDDDRNGAVTIKINGRLASYLREYQVDGVKFMYQAYKCNSGCVLADDMGLGKTVQVAALCSALLARTGDPVRDGDATLPAPGFLFIVPAQLTHQWRNELRRWAAVRVAIYQGSADTRSKYMDQIRAGTLDGLIVTHSYIRTGYKALARINWDLIVLDEAHAIKDGKSATSKGVKLVSNRCQRRIALSGTVMSNKLEELHEVVQWCCPGLLGSTAEFKRTFAEPIRKSLLRSATRYELISGRNRASELHQILKGGVLLRRRREDLQQELPGREDSIVLCELSDTQQLIYQQVIQSAECRRLTHTIQEHRPQQPAIDAAVGADVLRYLQRLQKLANHLLLLLPDNSDPKSLENSDRRFRQVAFQDQQQLYASLTEIMSPRTLRSKQALEQHSGKMKVLGTLLAQCHKAGDKVVLVSNSVRMLDILQHYVDQCHYSWARLDGQTSLTKRPLLLEDFASNAQRFILLLSSRTGGAGLNLACANVCIVFDPCWNPSMDLQAQERVFRIGQQRTVKLYRLIAAGSIEELIYCRQVYKQQLTNTGMLASHERRVFAEDEIFGSAALFRLYPPGSLMQKYLSRASRTEQNSSASSTLSTSSSADAAALFQTVPNPLHYSSSASATAAETGNATVLHDETAPSSSSASSSLPSNGDDDDEYSLGSLAMELTGSAAGSQSHADTTTSTVTTATTTDPARREVHQLLNSLGALMTTRDSDLVGHSEVERRNAERTQRAVALQFTPHEHSAKEEFLQLLNAKQRLLYDYAVSTNVEPAVLARRILEGNDDDANSFLLQLQSYRNTPS